MVQAISSEIFLIVLQITAAIAAAIIIHLSVLVTEVQAAAQVVPAPVHPEAAEALRPQEDFNQVSATH